MEPLVDLEREEHFYKGSERTNANKDNKTGKRKIISELKRKSMQVVSRAVSHGHAVSAGKAGSVSSKADNASKKLRKRK